VAVERDVPAQAVVDIKAMIQHIDELTIQLARGESRPN